MKDISDVLAAYGALSDLQLAALISLAGFAVAGLAITVVFLIVRDRERRR